MTALTVIDGDQLARHGTTSMYRHHSCRCLLCRLAGSRDNRERRAARRDPDRERRSGHEGPTGDTRWMARGACVNHPTDLWFPSTSDGRKGRPSGMYAGQAARAKKVCSTCPVVAECAAYAITNREEFGVWGGLDEDERRLIIRQSRP